MKYISFGLIFFTFGCTSAPKMVESLENLSKYNADCFIENEVLSERNVSILKEENNLFLVKAQDGKILSLPQNQCFLSKVDLNAGFNEELETKKKWVSCKLGPISFVSKPMIYVRDEKNFVELMRQDGSIWLLPREHCSINIL